MTAVAVDRGTLIRAKRSGQCAQCGCDFAVGDRIYFSRESGSRHERCVSPATAAAAVDARRRAAGDVDRDDDWHRPCAAVAAGDAATTTTPRQAEFEMEPYGSIRNGGGAVVHDEPQRRRDDVAGGVGVGDERRREVGEILQLVIDADHKLNEALQRIKRLLA